MLSKAIHVISDMRNASLLASDGDSARRDQLCLGDESGVGNERVEQRKISLPDALSRGSVGVSSILSHSLGQHIHVHKFIVWRMHDCPVLYPENHLNQLVFLVLSMVLGAFSINVLLLCVL